MEFVFVVKRGDLFPNGAPRGLLPLDDAAMAAHLALLRERGFFVERRHAERDPSMKQVIPYCVVVREGSVFRTRRLAGGGEARLHGKRSIGIGGHLNPGDAPDVVAGGLRRELEEELEFDGPFAARAVGLLNDDSTEVGSVHVGLVHRVETRHAVRVRETDVLEGGFAPFDEVVASCRSERETWETWSALVLDRAAEGDGRLLGVRGERPLTRASRAPGTNGTNVRARAPSGTR